MKLINLNKSVTREEVNNFVENFKFDEAKSKNIILLDYLVKKLKDGAKEFLLQRGDKFETDGIHLVKGVRNTKKYNDTTIDFLEKCIKLRKAELDVENNHEVTKSEFFKVELKKEKS